ARLSRRSMGHAAAVGRDRRRDRPRSARPQENGDGDARRQSGADALPPARSVRHASRTARMPSRHRANAPDPRPSGGAGFSADRRSGLWSQAGAENFFPAGTACLPPRLQTPGDGRSLAVHQRIARRYEKSHCNTASGIMTAYIGKPMLRVEDVRLLSGKGRYTDDLAPRDAAYAYVLRSPHAHAELRRIDVAAARGMPGVHAVLTAPDYRADGGKPIQHTPAPVDPVNPSRPAFGRADGSPPFATPQPVLAEDKVRYVGEPVAFLVADTLAQARDAAEAIEVDYAPLPALVSIPQAMDAAAPQIWPDAPGNVAYEFTQGDADAADRALAGAALVLEHEFVNQRVVSCHMEPRAVFASFDAATGIYHVVAGSQGAVRQRAMLADCLGAPIDKVELICPDVGGGFGSRTLPHPELFLTTWAARRTGRAVRWRADRSEGFLTDHQGRDLTIRASVGFAGDGRLLGMRLTIFANNGATGISSAASSNSPRVSPSIYRVPALFQRIVGVVSNTTPVAPYR